MAGAPKTHDAAPRAKWIAAALGTLVLSACGRSMADWQEDLTEGNPSERRLAALALRDVGEADLQKAVLALLVRLRDPEREVVDASHETLMLLAPRAGELLVKAALSVAEHHDHPLAEESTDRGGLRTYDADQLFPLLRAAGASAMEPLEGLARGTGPRSEKARVLLDELRRPL